MTPSLATLVGIPKVFPLLIMLPSTFQNGLDRMTEYLNPNKCAQCGFSIKGNAVTDPDLKATINDNVLSTVDTFTYLGVAFARNEKWTNHVEGIFRKCVPISTFCKETSKFINTC